MAVSIDTVYQRVLSIANKEQRAYITPQEFNLLANQAQMEIFEQYFYDLDQFKRRPTDDGTMSDTIELIKRKLSSFTSVQNLVGGKTFPENYRTGKVFVRRGATWVEAKKVDNIDVNNRLFASLFHRDGLGKQPVYCESPFNGEDIHVTNRSSNPISVTGDVRVEVIDKPTKVEWGYDVIAEKALYNASRSTNFQLHQSEEGPLVIKILELAGITLNKPGIVQIADQEELKTIQQEKQ